MSRLDWFWRRLIVTKLYTQGWGKPEDMKRIFHLRKKLGNREVCRHLVAPDYPVYIDKEVIDGDCRLLDGHFMSPLKEILPGIMPEETEIARFQMVLPTEWKSSLRPICVQMGGTGDHGFGRRRQLMAKPLLQEEGIASLILENPFYGSRKPKHQFRSSLHQVVDLFIMGGCLILESLALFNWLDRQGYGPLGTSGISMGGHMASLGATNWYKPISLIPCMSGSTAAGVFTHGVLSTAIPWNLLMEQYGADDSYEREVKELIESPEPYWNTHSMYREGRKYYHELEDSYNSDSDSNSHLHIQSGNQTVHNNSGIQSTTSDSIETQSTFSNLSGNESKSIGINSNQSLHHESLENQSSDFKDFCNQSVCDTEGKTVVTSDTPTGLLGSLTNSFPGLPLWSKSDSEDDKVKQQLKLDCKHFMKGVMDECTHLGNFSVPVDPELIIIVSAENDEYIPVKGYLKLNEIWPGSQVRTLPRGHISGFFFERKEFRRAIADSFELHAAKYYNTELRRTT
ncbi:protein ABHD18-like isoform X1 [Mercenaria mercenaria]|uniref:protein ABHD18-like isoform X1 n=1 Tax=Mercenaria mercenaria TaxID=6596 RepID=UPI00234F17AD|nr:protein ABHD18-like isoform X1 [Mercenaria mercenaria]